MRAATADQLLEVRRALGLPTAQPAVVLAGATDTELTAVVERVAAERARAIDVRGEVTRLVVSDAAAFLDEVLAQVPAARQGELRLAFAEPGRSDARLVGDALQAVTLEEWAARREQLRIRWDPPSYEVRYQPVVALADQSIIGYESLLRATADGVVIQAGELIARAERGQWLRELDHLGRRLAVRGLGSWLGQGLLFLNVMAPDGHFDEAAVHSIIDTALEAGLDADQIVLEAVERNRYTDLNEAARQITTFRDRGVRIAVDDVGDGYAGLRVLSTFSPDIIKLAGQLVSEMAPAPGADGTGPHRTPLPPSPHTSPHDPASPHETTAYAVISAVVEIAHRTGAWVVAENIETEQQLRLLRGLGVDWGQGLHLGAPLHRIPFGPTT